MIMIRGILQDGVNSERFPLKFTVGEKKDSNHRAFKISASVDFHEIFYFSSSTEKQQIKFAVNP